MLSLQSWVFQLSREDGNSDKDKELVIQCLFHPSAIRPGRLLFPVHPVANKSSLHSLARLWKSPEFSPSHSQLFLVCFCLTPASNLFPRFWLLSCPLGLHNQSGFSGLTRELPEYFSSHFPHSSWPLGSSCSCSSPTQNTNLDVNSFGCFPSSIYCWRVGYEQRGRMEIQLE